MNRIFIAVSICGVCMSVAGVKILPSTLHSNSNQSKSGTGQLCDDPITDCDYSSGCVNTFPGSYQVFPLGPRYACRTVPYPGTCTMTSGWECTVKKVWSGSCAAPGALTSKTFTYTSACN